MECPFCHKEYPGRHCLQCEAMVPEKALFCMQCGARVIPEDVSTSPDPDENPDLDDRILCPDGTCTGIILDGKCSECGRPYETKTVE